MKGRIPIIIAVLCTCTIGIVTAQNNNLRISISGKLVDNGGTPVERATIGIYKKGVVTPLKATYSNKSGIFNFYNLPEGIYKLSISFVGFDKLQIEMIELSKTRRLANLGFIKLSRAEDSLASVDIIDTKKSIDFRTGQFTYHANETLLGEAATVTDLLKNVPMVDVDPEGDITIAGKPNTRIFINGKPTEYLAANITELLNTMSSETIDRIEVLENPPPKYSSDGEGIINIVLKTRSKPGANSNLSGYGGTINNYGLSNYTTFRNKELSLNTSYSYVIRQALSNSYTYSKIYPADTLFFRNNIGDRNTRTHGHNANVTGAWDINKTSNLHFVVVGGITDLSTDISSDNYYLDNKNLPSATFKQNANNTGNGKMYSFDADYTWTSPSKSWKATTGATYANNKFIYSRFLYRDNYNATGKALTPTQQLYDINGASHAVELNGDITHTWGKHRNNLGFGVDANFNNSYNNLVANNYNFSKRIYQINRSLTSNYGFRTDTYASYINTDLHTAGNWLIRLGARAEVTKTQYGLANLIDKNIGKTYANLFPLVTISHTFKERYNFALTYSERMMRPRDVQLNPQLQVSDSASVSYGNLYLNPSHIRQTEVSLGIVEKRWSVYPVLNYSYTTDAIVRLSAITPSGAGSLSLYNVSNVHNITFNIYGNYRFKKAPYFNGGITITRLIYPSLPVNIIGGSGYIYQFKAGAITNISYRTIFEVNFAYLKNTTQQSIISGLFTSSFGVRESFLQKRLSIRALAANLFNPYKNHFLLYESNFDINRNSSYANRNISLSCSYNIGPPAHK